MAPIVDNKPKEGERGPDDLFQASKGRRKENRQQTQTYGSGQRNGQENRYAPPSRTKGNIMTALKAAHDLNQKIACSHPLTALPDEADSSTLLQAMEELIQHFELPTYYQALLEQLKEALLNPQLTLSGQLLPHIQQDSLMPFGLEKAEEYHRYAWTAPYALKGYENMELSTQMLLFDAIQKGLNVEILDENDQFLKLWHGHHVEYVKNGNMTSKDNYVIPLAMANKTVTKKILAEADFPVPAGAEFSSLEEGLAYYPLIRDRQIVVKPKSTNFGLGISIFQEPASLEAYRKALEIAFSEDAAVLVEEFIAGTEYRFFVLDGQCEAVLLRVAANVVGDGQHTVRELVAIKNDNPLRGRDHRSPLEIIELGEIELLMLDQQGYGPDDILPAGVKVDLNTAVQFHFCLFAQLADRCDHENCIRQQRLLTR